MHLKSRVYGIIITNHFIHQVTLICFHAATYKGCHIQQNATDAVSRPMFGSVLQTTYSCVNTSADKNCNYDVHVLSAHQGNGDSINWNTVLGTGDINVDISYNGKEVSNKSLVLVLLSHYPMNWILNVPTNVTIDKVLLVSILLCYVITISR